MSSLAGLVLQPVQHKDGRVAHSGLGTNSLCKDSQRNRELFGKDDRSHREFLAGFLRQSECGQLAVTHGDEGRMTVNLSQYDITPAQMEQMLEFQRDLLKVTAGTSSAKTRIDDVCRLFESAVPNAVASIMLVDAGGHLQVFSAPSIPVEVIRQINDLKPGPGAGSCGNVIYRQEPVFVSDTQTDPRWEDLRSVAIDHHLNACWSMPIRNQDQKIVGTFALTSFTKGLPHLFEQQLLELAASVIALLLQQRQEELERQVLEEGMRRLSLVASRTTNGVIICDPRGITTWVNDGIQTLTGYTAEELLGRKPGDVLQGPQTDPYTVARMRAAINVGNGFEATLLNYTKTGKVYWVQIACTPFYKSDGNLDGFISTEVDVTALRRLSDFNALRAAVNQVVASSETDHVLLQSICDLAIQHAHLELAWIGRPDASDRIQFLARSGPALAYLENFYISTNPQIPEGQGPSGQSWRGQEPIYSQSFASIPGLKPWQERARSFGLDASATQPIFRGGQIWAVFSVYHAQSGIFDEELRVLLNTLAQDISHGLDRIDLLHRERQLAVAQRQLSEQLYEEKELAQITLSSVGDGVITTDVFGRVTFLNAIARDLSGWQSGHAMGRPVTDVLCLIDDMTRMSMVSPVDRVLGTGKAVNLGNHTLLVALGGVERHIES
ncbi:MAG: GAF domain-containing protein, partial [Thiomonas sp.]